MAEIHKLAEQDYMLGMKYQEIADKYHVTINTVKSWKKRHGWERQSKKGAHKNEERVHTKSENKKVQNDIAVIVRDNNELTEKQREFCLYYVRSFNATTAYLKTYECNYNTANAEGYKLLVKPCVKAEIDRLKNIKRQSIMINEDDILERYMKIAFADMTDFTEFGTKLELDLDPAGNMQIDRNGNIKTYKRNYLDFKNYDQVDGGLICEISVGKSGMKVKLEDRQKALDWLSNYFNMDPASKHKQWYDRQRLELEKSKINPPEEQDLPDDGFIEAMKGDVKAIWADEGDPND